MAMIVRRLLGAVLLAVMVWTGSGCTTIEDFRYPLVKKLQAHRAWRESGLDASADFKRGWTKGYYKVSTGSDGRVPVIPEERYWSTSYQNLEGQTAIEKWYSGYRAGALAAEQTGNREWHFIPACATEPMIQRPAYEEILPLPAPHLTPNGSHYEADTTSSKSHNQQ